MESQNRETTRAVQPLFVVGPLRAGTTFVRLILGMHPSINIFGEFEESVHLLDDTGWPEPSAFVRYLETQRAFLDKRLRMPSASSTYPEMVHGLWTELVSRTEKPIVGASIHSRFDRCPELWPDAKYVHVVRDPRDVARSCIGMGWVGNAYYGADYWIGAEKRWDVIVERVPSTHRHEIKYEELVLDPERVLTGVCAFLGLPYDPVMLTYPEHTSYGPPEKSLVEQWRRRMKPREVQLIEGRVGDMLEARGYDRVHPRARPTQVEQVALLLENRLGRVSFNVRRFGPRLWVKDHLGRLVPGSEFQRKTQIEMNEIKRKHLR